MGLRDFINKIPTGNELKGGFGEWLAKHYSKAFTDSLVLHDILIEGKDGYTSQIDMILIDSRGLFVVEAKMYPDANIYGDGNKSKWYYYNHGQKYEIYSPIIQNQKHITYLKSFLKDFGDVPCFSMILLMCNDFKISNINKTDKIDTLICGGLLAINKGIKYISSDNPSVLDEAKKAEIYDYITSQQIVGKDARLKHKQNVQEYKQELENMKAQKICPYCKLPLVLRKGKYGDFYGCPNYPRCRYTGK